MTVPFLWADKRMLREIRNKTEAAPTAVAVYLALCELASDSGSDVFTASQSAISKASGCSVRTVGTRIQELKAVGAIEVRAAALDAPANFKLLPFRDAPALGNGCRALRNECGALGNGVPDPLQSTSKKNQESRKPLSTPQRITAEKRLETARRQLSELSHAGLREKSEPDYKPRKAELEAEVRRLEEALHV